MSITCGVIIGAMKSGTTSLYYYLAEHPEIAEIKDKEPHFFSMDQVYAKGPEWYRSLWSLEETHKVMLEASTTYAMNPKYPHTLDRIAEAYDENFKFIYVVRNPIKRIESHMRHMLAEGLVKSCEIIDDYIHYSEYARQLDLYAERFGSDRIKTLTLEGLTERPHEILQETCTFLGVDPTYQFERVGTVMNSQQTLNLHPWVRGFYRNPIVKTLVKTISPNIRQALYKPLSRSKPLSAKLDPEQKSFILKRLTPDLQRLRDHYGIDAKAAWGIEI